jgi:hypothetical protein
MSETTPTAPAVAEPFPVRRASSLRRTTVVAGLAAAVVTAVAAAVHAAGVSFEVDGEVIPLAGFAQATFLGAVIGGVVLAVLDRRSRSPRRRLLRRPWRSPRCRASRRSPGPTTPPPSSRSWRCTSWPPPSSSPPSSVTPRTDHPPTFR